MMLTSSERFGAITITTGTVTVQATGIASAERFGAAITSLGALVFTIQAYGIPSELKFGASYIGPEIDDAIIWRQESNIIYVADEDIDTINAIDAIVYADDEAVDAIGSPEEV